METVSVIISGVTVFLIGEIIVRFFLGPLHKFKEIKGEIASILLFHANNYGQQYAKLDEILGNEGGDKKVVAERIASAKQWNSDLSKASDETRAVAAKLISVAEGIPFFKMLSFIRVVPPKSSILKSKKHLIGLSNSFTPNQSDACAKRSEEICKLLLIEFIDE
jgi:hypothetical protein